ncbi:hypothetical protein MWN33_12055 [Starkeya koreensis]|uniref:Secreted protein n=1 Tax=Ancylobacter koreensis TaxID=266121 RepID=A0ABT0DNB3_9HYPH|nr:hypothetical protein [Ancylobacter koreensis]MCK0208762.1 hypothetical protein [Ancylobacter koreensis]
MKKRPTHGLKQRLVAPLTLIATLAGVGALLLFSVADATTEPAQAGAQAAGYRSCFMQSRADFTGDAPRMVRERRCVIAK